MNDLISRQMAIDAIQEERHEAWEDLKNDTEYRNGYDNGLAESMRILIDDLPAAQPEIVRCKHCKYNTSSHKCLHPDSFFLVPADDFYCGYEKRRTE